MLVAWVGQADPIVADVFGFSKRIRAGAPRTKTLCGERMRDPAHSPNSSQRSTAAQRTSFCSSVAIKRASHT